MTSSIAQAHVRRPGEQNSLPEMAKERAAEQTRTPHPIDTAVTAIMVGAVDARGETIETVFFKRSNYAIYSASEEVTVQYSDDESIATEQIAAMSDIIPLRDKLQFMVAGRAVPGCYRRHIADASRLALEGKAIVAQEILRCAIDDVLGYKARTGRTTYLMFAGPVALLACAVLLAAGCLSLFYGQHAIGLLLLASSGGAMGALLSIAIALRTRTVAVDDDLRANRLDGLIRLLIGIISGGALFLVLVTGVVANIKIATMQNPQATIEAAWQAALIIGFAAGFFERLVPDLLEKSLEQRPKVTSSLGEKPRPDGASPGGQAAS